MTPGCLHRCGRGAAAGLMLLLTAALAAGETRANDARSGPDPQLREILLSAVDDASSFRDRFDAEVWLTDMSRRLSRQVPDPDERLRILRIVHQQSQRVNVSPELVLAVIDVESNFDRYAISHAGALGLMQVMPFWVSELGYDDMNILFDIELNVLLGARILRYYLDRENGDMIRGLARYNGSLGQSWYSDRVLERLRTRWFPL